MAIDGIWYNELGSSMKVLVTGNTISGIYHNAAGPAAGDYPFAGVIDAASSGSNQAVAWVVTWYRASDKTNWQSVTAWSGQYQLVNDPQTNQQSEKITTEWLLTSETTPGDDWLSTKIGHDVFSRTPPDQAAVEARMKLKAWPHPHRELK